MKLSSATRQRLRFSAAQPQFLPLLLASTSSSSSSPYTLMNEALSWSEAKDACLREGFQLATVQSAAENALLVKAAEGNIVWIGGTDAKSENTWVWSPSGTTISYTNWRRHGGKREPNNNGGNENCIDVNYFWVERGKKEVDLGKWNDAKCSIEHKYVCQTVMSPPSLPPPSPPPPSPSPPSPPPPSPSPPLPCTSGNASCACADNAVTGPTYTCTAWGDPHYTTFGGLVHDFYGKGLYEHARFAIAPCGCEVVIQTLLATLGRASAIAAIAVRVGDTTFEITGGGEVTIRQLGGSSSSRSLRDGGPDHAHFCNGGCMCSSARIAHLGGGFTCRAVLVTSWSSRGCIDAPGASTTTRGSVSRGA